MTLRELAKQFVPPILLDGMRRCRRSYGYFGDYASWEAAALEATGYDSAEILSRVESAVLAVAKGGAVAERDSVLFAEIPYSWPVLAGLLRASAVNGNRLCVLDFGGSLGSSYFHCREFLSPLERLQWHVVEQPHFVSCEAAASLTDDSLKFFASVEAALAHTQADVLLLSSVLQYLPEPIAFLREMMARRFPHILIDRTPFSSSRQRLTVQRVHPSVYPGSYPAWLLDLQAVRECLAEVYDEVALFTCDESAHGVTYRGMICSLAGPQARHIDGV